MTTNTDLQDNWTVVTSVLPQDGSIELATPLSTTSTETSTENTTLSSPLSLSPVITPTLGRRLVGGYKSGEKVVYIGSGFADSDGAVEYGDGGKVMGSATLQGYDLEVEFPGLKGNLNTYLSSIKPIKGFEPRHQTHLKGGFRIGDQVFNLAAEYSDEFGVIKPGDKGVVVGTATTIGFDIMVEYRAYKGGINVFISDLKPIEGYEARHKKIKLKGGYNVGDEIINIGPGFSDEKWGKVECGACGVITGQATRSGYDFVLCFETYQGGLNEHWSNVVPKEGYEEKHKVDVSSGYRIGDAVKNIGLDYNSKNGVIEHGDIGVVVGPATKPGYDLTINYDEIKVVLNDYISNIAPIKGYEERHKIEVQGSGYRIGDEVIYVGPGYVGEQGKLESSDKGTIVGPATLEGYALVAQYDNLVGGFNHHLSGVKHAKGNACPKELAQVFISQLQAKVLQNLPAYRHADEDKCYCDSCYPTIFPDTELRGRVNYIIPRGWVRFGLTTPPRMMVENLWLEWCTTFYGVRSPQVLQSILGYGSILVPGDKLIDGSIMKGSHRSVNGEQDASFYTSPTIKYSGITTLATPQPFEVNGEQMMASIVLQCKQDPGSIVAQQETVGFRSQEWIDAGGRDIAGTCQPHVHPNLLEWKSNQKHLIIPYAILIRVWSKDKDADEDQYSGPQN
eukprot:m.111019 g.111019  ORF g.111019 m.111019 type:complete len:676 (-) comp28083_c0_seq1:77-2104(-)